MKIGMTLEDLAQKVISDKAATRDFIVPTKDLRYLAPRNDAPNGSVVFDFSGTTFEAPPTDHAFEQIVSHVGIPRTYADRMKTEAPQLLATNVSHWLAHNNTPRMVRTLHNGTTVTRAFLSNRFRALDYVDMIEALLPALLAAGCEIKSCSLTETRLYLQAVTPRVTGEVRKGEVVQAGVVLTNSEVGAGAFKIESMLYILACTNGQILGKAMRRAHLGGQFGDDSDVREFLKDETRALSDKAIFAQAHDVVEGLLNEDRFRASLGTMQLAASEQLGDDLPRICEVTAKALSLNVTEQSSILKHLAKGGDFSRWGLINAVTRTAEDAPDYDRAVELERLGTEILAIPAGQFIAPTSKN